MRFHIEFPGREKKSRYLTQQRRKKSVWKKHTTTGYMFYSIAVDFPISAKFFTIL